MLTITWVSRNDNHGGGELVHRIQVTLDALIEWWQMFNWNLELIFVEWNPLPSKHRLRSLIKYPDAFPIQFIEVPAEIHNQYNNADKIGVFPAIGANVGMRRAQGDWVLTTTHDDLFPFELGEFLAQGNFDSGAFYRAERWDTGIKQFSNMSTKERVVLAKKNIIRYNKYTGGLFTKASGDFIMMPRQVWHTIRGYPEWPILGIYYDGILIHCANALGLKQTVLPYPVYHIEHGNRGLDLMRRLPHLPRKVYDGFIREMERTGRPLKANNENWGLGSCQEIQIAHNVIRLIGGQPPDNRLPY